MVERLEVAGPLCDQQRPVGLRGPAQLLDGVGATLIDGAQPLIIDAGGSKGVANFPATAFLFLAAFPAGGGGACSRRSRGSEGGGGGEG